ncbi:MAG: helix-turn-helix transcriptional regulator [Saprospiraceae bacterium]
MEDDTFFIENVNRVIEKHLSSHKMKGSFIAHELSISRMQLYRKLKKITFQDARTYILSKRIAYAKRELKQTSKYVYQIAKNCGFKDYTYFSKSFKKQVGVSPTEFRRREK